MKPRTSFGYFLVLAEAPENKEWKGDALTLKRMPQNSERGCWGIDVYRRKIFIGDKSVADGKYFFPWQILFLKKVQ